MITGHHPQAFKGELARAFAAGFMANTTEDARRQAAFAAAAAFDRVQQTRPANVVLDAQWAALDAAATSARFIQAVLLKMLPPDQLAQMDAPAIAQTRQEYDGLSDQQWRERVALFSNGAQV